MNEPHRIRIIPCKSLPHFVPHCNSCHARTVPQAQFFFPRESGQPWYVEGCCEAVEWVSSLDDPESLLTGLATDPQRVEDL